MTIAELQALIEKMYSEKDRKRGTPATFLWLSEEIGELATALREGTHEEQTQPSQPIKPRPLVAPVARRPNSEERHMAPVNAPA